MLRTFVCAVVAFLLAVGVTTAAEKEAKKGKKRGAGAHGVVKSIDVSKGTLVLSVGKKDSKEDKTFTISKDTPVYKFSGKGKKPEKASLEDIKTGDHVGVRLDEDGKTVKGLVIGGGRKGKGTKPKE